MISSFQISSRSLVRMSNMESTKFTQLVTQIYAGMFVLRAECTRKKNKMEPRFVVLMMMDGCIPVPKPTFETGFYFFQKTLQIEEEGLTAEQMAEVLYSVLILYLGWIQHWKCLVVLMICRKFSASLKNVGYDAGHVSRVGKVCLRTFLSSSELLWWVMTTRLLSEQTIEPTCCQFNGCKKKRKWEKFLLLFWARVMDIKTLFFLREGRKF